MRDRYSSRNKEEDHSEQRQISYLTWLFSCLKVVKENMMKFVLMALVSVLLIVLLIVLSLFFLIVALSPTAGKRVFLIRRRLQQLWYGSGSSRYRCRHCRRCRDY